MLRHPKNYWIALEELERRYYRPHLLSEFYFQDLLGHRPIAVNDRVALLSLCRKVTNVLRTLESIGQVMELHSVIFMQLVHKLPPFKQEQWGKIKFELYQRVTPKVADQRDFQEFHRANGCYRRIRIHPETGEKRGDGRATVQTVKVPHPETLSNNICYKMSQ